MFKKSIIFPLVFVAISAQASQQQRQQNNHVNHVVPGFFTPQAQISKQSPEAPSQEEKHIHAKQRQRAHSNQSKYGAPVRFQGF